MSAMSKSNITIDSIARVTSLFAGFIAVMLIHEVVFGHIVTGTTDGRETPSEDVDSVVLSGEGRDDQPLNATLDVAADSHTGADAAETAAQLEGVSSDSVLAHSEPLATAQPAEDNTSGVEDTAESGTAPSPLALNQALEREPEPIHVPEDDTDSAVVDAEQPASNSLAQSDPVASASNSRPAQTISSPTETTWSAVWRPFYSLRTAEGFATYISDSTGLDLRVSQSRIPGQYLVEVQHGSELERLEADRLIVETTGYKPADALR